LPRIGDLHDDRESFPGQQVFGYSHILWRPAHRGQSDEYGRSVDRIPRGFATVGPTIPTSPVQPSVTPILIVVIRKSLPAARWRIPIDRDKWISPPRNGKVSSRGSEQSSSTPKTPNKRAQPAYSLASQTSFSGRQRKSLTSTHPLTTAQRPSYNT